MYISQWNEFFMDEFIRLVLGVIEIPEILQHDPVFKYQLCYAIL